MPFSDTDLKIIIPSIGNDIEKKKELLL